MTWLKWCSRIVIWQAVGGAIMGVVLGAGYGRTGDGLRLSGS
jgi:membrane associated rhomboid family serine protease